MFALSPNSHHPPHSIFLSFFLVSFFFFLHFFIWLLLLPSFSLLHILLRLKRLWIYIRFCFSIKSPLLSLYGFPLIIVLFVPFPVFISTSLFLRTAATHSLLTMLNSYDLSAFVFLLVPFIRFFCLFFFLFLHLFLSRFHFYPAFFSLLPDINAVVFLGAFSQGVSVGKSVGRSVGQSVG